MEPKASQGRSHQVEQAVRVSAVVVTRHTGQPLELCLRSLLAEPWIDELVIVDNGNPDPVASALRALQADRRDVRLVQGQGDIGAAAGANLGASRARGRWLLFIDPAVVLQRGAVERMVAAGGGARSPWIIGGRLTDTLGREQRSTQRRALTAWSAASIALGLVGGKPDNGGMSKAKKARDTAAAPSGTTAFADPVPVASVSGSFMLIPRQDFQALGGFDEGYATHGEDLDLCRRAGEAGGAVLLQPAAAAVRFSASKRASRGRREAQGLARFVAKSARTPAERVFALFARPLIGMLLLVRGLRRGVASSGGDQG